MGKPMVLNLLKAGHQLFLSSRSEMPKAFAEQGATICTNTTEAAKQAHIVLIMVPGTPHVQDVLLGVLFGESGEAKGLKKSASGPNARLGELVVDMGLISPMATKLFAKKINDPACEYLDAPVSGAEVGARAASPTTMVGGPQAAFERVKLLLRRMGKNISLVGGNVNGDGQTTKVANQITVALNIEAVAKALLFASNASATASAKVREALMGCFAASRVLTVHGERMVKRSFKPGFRSELHQKDLNLAQQEAKEQGWRCRTWRVRRR